MRKIKSTTQTKIAVRHKNVLDKLNVGLVPLRASPDCGLSQLNIYIYMKPDTHYSCIRAVSTARIYGQCASGFKWLWFPLLELVLSSALGREPPLTCIKRFGLYTPLLSKNIKFQKVNIKHTIERNVIPKI